MPWNQEQIEEVQQMENLPISGTYTEDTSKKQRFDVLSGMFKELAERASLDKELFEKLRGVLTAVLNDE